MYKIFINKQKLNKQLELEKKIKKEKEENEKQILLEKKLIANKNKLDTLIRRNRLLYKIKQNNIIDKINNNKKFIGNQNVYNINDVIYDINNTIINIKNGYSFLLRIKNEEATIKKCILDIVDLADEIIVVDNNSSDNTLNIVLDLEKKYNNIIVYQYKINIPRVGKEHIENKDKSNTLTNYYNWTASKATYNKLIKWDGDFYTIKENLKELLDKYRNINDYFAVWFSGLTLFVHNDKQYFKNFSYYDEYRLFCNKDKKVWSDNIINNKNYCETSIDFVNNIQNKYKFEKPIFIEIKNTNKDEFTSRSTLLQDGRDNIDYDILNKLQNNKLHDLLIESIDINEDYKNFILDNNLKFINKFNDYKIGIYSIFIGLYSNYLDDFISNIEKNFFPNINKKYFIVTDKDIYIQKENIYIIKIDNKYIGWPLPTLYRFKYFKQIPDIELNNIDYMFFLNANAIIKQKIDITNIPIDTHDYIFTLHNWFHRSSKTESYERMTLENNSISTAYIPNIKNYKYEYIVGGFYGAKMDYFIKLNNLLYDNIGIDLKNNFIAKWHDESHLNNFYFNNKNIINVYILDITYHVPEIRINEFENIMILYLNKSNNSNINKYKDNIESKSNIIIDTNLIEDYKNFILDNNLKFINKNKILLIIDSYGWAFDNITSNLKKYSNNNEFQIVLYSQFYKDIQKDKISIDYDHVIFFGYWGINKDILDYLCKKNIKSLNLCIYDYSLWINNHNKNDEDINYNNLLYFFKKINNCLYASPYIYDLIKAKNLFNTNNMYKCYDGVDIELFKFYGYDETIYTKKKLKIGWIGNSNPEVHGINKGFVLIKDVVSNLSDKFDFCPQDRWTGTILPHDKIPDYIKDIDIIICFSIAEGTPNQILEASSCGKCWISTKVGITSELYNTIDNNPTGILIDRDTNILKRELEFLYNNRDIIVQYGQNGRKAIEKSWSWKHNANYFYSFIEKITNN